MIEDPAIGQTSKDDKKSIKSSSHGTISEASQRPAKNDILPENKNVQLPSGQETFKNSGTMSAENSIEINVLLSNKKSGGQEKIATEIEWLKKEQKKAQIKSKLYYLKEHAAQKFVKNVFEKKFYTQRLALERAKKFTILKCI